MNFWFEDNGNSLYRLGRDECYVHFKSDIPENAYLYSVYKECYKCPFTLEYGPLPKTKETIIQTKYEKLYRILKKNVEKSILDSNDSVHCDFDPQFGEFGVYNVHVKETGCRVETLVEPVNIYFPLLTACLIYGLIFAMITILLHARRKIKDDHDKNIDIDLEKIQKKSGKERLKSLDTFRGISIVLMIFVNYGAGGYNFIDHAVWNGLNIGDLVFPWFMWIMGVCIPISIMSSFKKEIPKKKSILLVLRRSCKLFAIGLFLGASPYLDKLRIFGVLQRFGICYFVVATLCLLLMSKESPTTKTIFQNFIKDLTALKSMWLIMTVIICFHCVITFLLPVPDCPTGYLGPGGIHEDGKYFNCTGGAAGYIDQVILGNHIYHHPTAKEIYKSLSFDPEGILGCFTSIVQVFFGVQAGVILLQYKEHLSRIARWLVWAVIYGLLGGILCGFSKEDGVIPLNKNLWSLSFVLVTSSFAFILLSVCYFIIDVQKYWSGKPFLFAGMNAIIMYIGHSMTPNNFPIHWYTSKETMLNTHFISTIENTWATCIWVLVAFYLYKIKYFFSI